MKKKPTVLGLTAKIKHRVPLSIVYCPHNANSDISARKMLPVSDSTLFLQAEFS